MRNRRYVHALRSDEKNNNAAASLPRTLGQKYKSNAYPLSADDRCASESHEEEIGDLV